MKAVLEISTGARPWLPNPSVSVGEVLDEYDVPLSGLLYDGGRAILFTNLVGDAEASGIWAYARISDDELQALLAAHDAETFDAARDAALRDRPVTIAAVLDHEIAFSSTLDAGVEGVHGLAERFFSQTERRIREVDHASSEIRGAQRPPVLT